MINSYTPRINAAYRRLVLNEVSLKDNKKNIIDGIARVHVQNLNAFKDTKKLQDILTRIDRSVDDAEISNSVAEISNIVDPVHKEEISKQIQTIFTRK